MLFTRLEPIFGRGSDGKEFEDEIRSACHCHRGSAVDERSREYHSES
jgi:hypothetical protein